MIIFSENPQNMWIEMRGIKQGKIEIKRFQNSQEAREWSYKASQKGLNSYYGMAYRKEELGTGTKQDCSYVTSLWVDRDEAMAENDKLIDFILPPSKIICSGKGQHIYWELDQPQDDQKEVERVLKKLCTIYGGDRSLAQFAAILRVPGTFNYKYDPPKIVYEISSTGQTYTFNELKIAVSGNFTKWLKEAHKDVLSGERSEHEYKLVNQLFEFGFTSNTISYLIKHHTSETSKANEDESNLQFTIDKVEEKLIENKKPKQVNPLANLTTHDIFEGDGCYCAISKEGNPIAISNFVYDLKAIQSGANGAFICDIIAGKSRWNKQVIEQKIFSSELTFKQSLPYAQMAWYGNSNQTMKLKQLLADTWEYEGLPLIQVTKQLGRQFGDKYVTSDGVYDKNLAKQEDILYVEPAHEHPDTKLYTSINPKQALSDLLKVNNHVNIQTMLGWFTACYIKPVLHEYGIRFPHLLVCGTRGAGKTTLITKVFQPLAGYKDIQLWQANSTPFVLLTLLGSSTSVPVCLTEFRDSTQKSHARFLQLLRSAYDFGKDARGKADLSTIIYNLDSPICIDGEELITDPALLERIIPVYLDVRDVAKAGKSLNTLLAHDLHGVGAYFLEYTLQLPNNYIFDTYTDCLNSLDTLTIPQRIKNNYAVINLGLKLVSNMLNLADELEVMPDGKTKDNRSKADTVQPNTEILVEGGKTAALEFLQDLLIYIMSDDTRDILYRRKAEKENSQVGFHLTTAYDWWRTKNQKFGRDTPPLLTIKRQVKELDKIFLDSRPALTDQGRLVHCHFVDLVECSKVLDIDIF